MSVLSGGWSAGLAPSYALCGRGVRPSSLSDGGSNGQSYRFVYEALAVCGVCVMP